MLAPAPAQVAFVLIIVGVMLVAAASLGWTQLRAFLKGRSLPRPGRGGVSASRREVSLPAAQEESAADRAQTVIPVLPIHAQAPYQRGHVLFAASTGDGKTQSQIAMLVSDIQRGAQVIWLNPHLALYHPTDQPTDLRPLRDHFEPVDAYEAIARALGRVCGLIEERKPIYREGGDVGHAIVVYIDEWPATMDMCGEAAVRPLRAILREGRKYNVWVVLAAQDALVDTLGFQGGVRKLFTTRYAGNVDKATWTALFDGVVAQERVPQGWWMSQRGLAQVVRPSSDVIGHLAARPSPSFALLSVTSTPEHVDRVVRPALGERTASQSAVRPVRSVRKTLTTDELALVVARIIANERTTGKKLPRSEMVKKLPRYQAPLYDEFKSLYDELLPVVQVAVAQCDAAERGPMVASDGSTS